MEYADFRIHVQWFLAQEECIDQSVGTSTLYAPSFQNCAHKHIAIQKNLVITQCLKLW